MNSKEKHNKETLRKVEKLIHKDCISKKVLAEDKKIMEEVALDLFGKEQIRWRHTKLTKQFNEVLERNSDKLMQRVAKLKELLATSEDEHENI